jgi:hypothetical protein
MNTGNTPVALLLMLLILILSILLNRVPENSEKIYLSSDLSRSTMVAKHLYEKGEYATQVLPLIVLRDYRAFPTTKSGAWINADRFHVQPFVLAAIKWTIPSLSFQNIAMLFSTTCFLMIALIVCWGAKKFVGKEYSCIALVTICIFPNLFVQVYNKGGEDIVLFSLLAFICLSNTYQARKANWYWLFIGSILLFFSRNYLVFILVSSYLTAFNFNLRVFKRTFYFCALLFISLMPFFIYNVYVFGTPLFSVNSISQIYFDLPISNYSNTWWLLDLEQNNSDVFVQITNKMFQSIQSNIWFIVVNWPTAIYSIYLLYKYKRDVSESNYKLAKFVSCAALLTLILLSPLGFSGPTIDYFIFLVPLICVVITVAIQLVIQNKVKIYEINIFLFTIVFFLFRRLWSENIINDEIENFIFSLSIAFLIIYGVFFLFQRMRKNTKLHFTKIFMFFVIPILLIRPVQDWIEFVVDFSVTGLNDEIVMREIQNAELILSLNDFWGVANYTNARVLALPENPNKIAEVIRLSGVDAAKTLILVSNPPKDVRKFAIPLGSQVYVERFHDLNEIGDFKFYHKTGSVVLWKPKS